MYNEYYYTTNTCRDSSNAIIVVLVFAVGEGCACRSPTGRLSTVPCAFRRPPGPRLTGLRSATQRRSRQEVPKEMLTLSGSECQEAVPWPKSGLPQPCPPPHFVYIYIYIYIIYIYIHIYMYTYIYMCVHILHIWPNFLASGPEAGARAAA